jgi:hypothetical protein
MTKTEEFLREISIFKEGSFPFPHRIDNDG